MDDHDLLLRVDEKVTALHGRFDTFEGDIKNWITEHQEADKEAFVTKEEFRPVKAIVFGMVGTVLTAVVVAVVTLILKVT